MTRSIAKKITKQTKKLTVLRVSITELLERIFHVLIRRDLKSKLVD